MDWCSQGVVKRMKRYSSIKDPFRLIPMDGAVALEGQHRLINVGSFNETWLYIYQSKNSFHNVWKNFSDIVNLEKSSSIQFIISKQMLPTWPTLPCYDKDLENESLTRFVKYSTRLSWLSMTKLLSSDDRHFTFDTT